MIRRKEIIYCKHIPRQRIDVHDWTVPGVNGGIVTPEVQTNCNIIRSCFSRDTWRIGCSWKAQFVTDRHSLDIFSRHETLKGIHGKTQPLKLAAFQL